MTIFTEYMCDKCGTKSGTDKNLIVIGSEDGKSFKYRNKNGRMLEMNGHGDIHFCTQECMVSYFFKVD